MSAGVGDEPPTVLGVRGEVVDAPAELALRRVEAAERERDGEVEESSSGSGSPWSGAPGEVADQVDVGVERARCAGRRRIVRQ